MELASLFSSRLDTTFRNVFFSLAPPAAFVFIVPLLLLLLF